MPTLEEVPERIELTVSKEKLQLFTWVIGGLLSIVSLFSYQVLRGIDTLKENSQDFKTYIRTNDQRYDILKRDFEEHLKKDHEAYLENRGRIEKLENNEDNFWRQYGWLFRQADSKK